MNLLEKPLCQMTRDEILEAVRLRDEKIKRIQEENANYVMDMSNAKLHIIKDDLGVQGILNHADGKMYDSKSAYYKALKESGHIIHESGMDKPRKQRGDYDVSKELKEAAQRCGLI